MWREKNSLVLLCGRPPTIECLRNEQQSERQPDRTENQSLPRIDRSGTLNVDGCLIKQRHQPSNYKHCAYQHGDDGDQAMANRFGFSIHSI